MALYMMKASPDEDFYILMSTILDAPVLLGTMEQLQEGDSNPEWKAEKGYSPTVNFVKLAHAADERGSSSFVGNGTWDAETVTLSNLGSFSTNTEYWELPRNKVSEFFHAYMLDINNKDYEETLLNKYCTPCDALSY